MGLLFNIINIWWMLNRERRMWCFNKKGKEDMVVDILCLNVVYMEKSD